MSEQAKLCACPGCLKPAAGRSRYCGVNCGNKAGRLRRRRAAVNRAARELLAVRPDATLKDAERHATALLGRIDLEHVRDVYEQLRPASVA